MSAGIGGFLKPDGFAGPHGVLALVREAGSSAEVVRGMAALRADRRDQRRRGFFSADSAAGSAPVVLIPGFMAGDWSLNQMSQRLRLAGWRTYRSDINVNAGCTQRASEHLERRVEAISLRRNQPVTLVGHSLGGLLARGLAARRPDLVAGIVTLGSPVLAPGAVHGLLRTQTRLLTRLSSAGIGGLMSADCVAGQCARMSWDEAQAPLPDDFGYTAIYSKRDGIVDWRSCLDPAAAHIEVTASHCGMAADPTTYDVVLAAITQQKTRANRPATRSDAADLRPVVNT